MATMSETMVLWKYFGLRDDQKDRKEFMAEVRVLTDEEKTDLAEMCGKELGVTVTKKATV